MGLFTIEAEEQSNIYSKKLQPPQYVPSETKPQLGACYNSEKYVDLIRHINKSNLSDDEKTFLKFAASRHIVFNYSKIADYYAHSSKEMQELMEESALVVIDINDAIANGYVRLSENIKAMLKDSGESTNG